MLEAWASHLRCGPRDEQPPQDGQRSGRNRDADYQGECCGRDGRDLGRSLENLDANSHSLSPA